MKGFIGVLLACVGFGVSLCGFVAAMWLVGFGTPNCEPTTYGYADFWSKLFASGFAASFGLWCVVGVGCVVAQKFANKGN